MKDNESSLKNLVACERKIQKFREDYLMPLLEGCQTVEAALRKSIALGTGAANRYVAGGWRICQTL